MNLSETDSEKIDPKELPSVYSCPHEPVYTWILTETAAFYVSITTKSIASPLTVLLNVLIIVAVWRRRALQKNSNILLTSMAVADLLVGAVSMPLTIASDILLLREKLSLKICKIAGANQIVLYSAVSSSFYHLTFIAWERYVAIVKWTNYKNIITKTRLKICAVVAWVLAAIAAIVVPILSVAEVDQKVIAGLSIFSGSKTVLCVAIIGYCYITLYLYVRKRKNNEINEVSVRANAKLEKSIAKATGTVTAVLLVSYVPSIIALLLGDAVPVLRTSSYFRWSELLIQMNSFFNPIVYCFAMNRTFRNEVLEMINLNSVLQLELRPKLPVKRPTRRRREPAVVSEEENQLHGERQLPDRLARRRSCDSIELADLRAINSSPSPTSEDRRVVFVDVHQPSFKRRKPLFLHNPSQSENRGDESSLPTSEPSELTSIALPGKENRAISVHEDQAILSKQKPQFRYTGESTDKNRVKTEDENDFVKDSRDADVIRERSWPRRVPLELTPVLGRRNIQLKGESINRPKTR
ncbi:unnamed protein product [Porites lobata]|uniref:G-protein coupled receptors family 1 profile domain-containing protein n=1 Tax=Porites lobata TaxID=104759 RepID=A0ABN8MVX9_9CNID|nr:unnamed protein product [Porites lobata]